MCLFILAMLYIYFLFHRRLFFVFIFSQPILFAFSLIIIIFFLLTQRVCLCVSVVSCFSLSVYSQTFRIFLWYTYSVCRTCFLSFARTHHGQFSHTQSYIIFSSCVVCIFCCCCSFHSFSYSLFLSLFPVYSLNSFDTCSHEMRLSCALALRTLLEVIGKGKLWNGKKQKQPRFDIHALAFSTCLPACPPACMCHTQKKSKRLLRYLNAQKKEEERKNSSRKKNCGENWIFLSCVYVCLWRIVPPRFFLTLSLSLQHFCRPHHSGQTQFKLSVYMS